MPSREKYIRKFRVVHDVYEDVWILGITVNIDWADENGTRDKYVSIHLGRHTIMIGLISKYIEEEN